MSGRGPLSCLATALITALNEALINALINALIPAPPAALRAGLPPPP